jgi:hypothetical protein
VRSRAHRVCYQNAMVGARIAEIMAVGAKRAEVTAEEVLRELKALGFSDIGKVVRWRPEVVYEEVESEDEPDKPARQVMVSRVMVVDSETLAPNVRLAVASARLAPTAMISAMRAPTICTATNSSTQSATGRCYRSCISMATR